MPETCASARPASRPVGVVARMLAAAVFVAIGPASFALAAATLKVQDGNLSIEIDGKLRPLTTTGRDSEAVLAPDGRSIYFTRSAAKPGADDDATGCSATGLKDELRRIDIDGSADVLILAAKRGSQPETTLCQFAQKQFSSDGKKLYFLSPAWATSGALHVLTLADKRERYVAAALDAVVLSFCTAQDFRDALALRQHRYFQLGGSFDWFWLFDPTGKTERGPLGDFDDITALTKEIQDSAMCTD